MKPKKSTAAAKPAARGRSTTREPSIVRSKSKGFDIPIKRDRTVSQPATKKLKTALEAAGEIAEAVGKRTRKARTASAQPNLSRLAITAN